MRPSLGSAAGRVVWRDTWRPLVIVYLFIGLAAGSVASLLAGLP